MEINTMKTARSVLAVTSGLYMLLKWMAKTHSGMWMEAWCPLNGIVDFTVWVMILQQQNHLLLVHSFGQTINSTWVALHNNTYRIPPLERRFRSGSHFQYLTSKDNEKQFKHVKYGAFCVIAPLLLSVNLIKIVWLKKKKKISHCTRKCKVPWNYSAYIWKKSDRHFPKFDNLKFYSFKKIN